MQSIQTGHPFVLSSVKPLEGLLRYRDYCLEATRKVLSRGSSRRVQSPINNEALEPWGQIGGLDYLQCPKTGSLFLAELPSAPLWGALLKETNDYRNSSKGFHADIVKTRLENVYQPKCDWIKNTLKLQGVKCQHLLELATLPNPFTALLKAESEFKAVTTLDETLFLSGKETENSFFDVAVLLESLDRVHDPLSLLRQTAASLKKGGLLFVTALAASGFDFTLLGKNNTYLYPPDRTNCFSLEGLKQMLARVGFGLVEVSTPGVLDVEVVQAHLRQKTGISLSPFEKRLLSAGPETHSAFQSFLQQCNLSSFVRVVGKKGE